MYELLPNILSVIIAFAAFILSILAYTWNKRGIKLQEKNFEMQKDHFQKSLKPNCNIRCTEMDKSICIDIYNSGQGFMIIKNIEITTPNKDESYKALHKVFPPNIRLAYYSVDLRNYGVPVNTSVSLVKTEKLNDDELKRIRSILAKYIIEINYIDVYDNEYNAHKELSILYGKEHRSQNG